MASDSGRLYLPDSIDPDAWARPQRDASGRVFATALRRAQSAASAGAGSALEIRAQQGAAGQVGGNVNLMVGDGGTPGSDLPGNLDVTLGTIDTSAGNITGKLRFLTGTGAVIGQFYYNNTFFYLESGAAASTGWLIRGNVASVVEGSSQVSLSVPGGVLFDLGFSTITSYVAGIQVRNEALASAGACTVQWVHGVTSVTYNQAQHATAAGNPHNYTGQQGDNDFAGGSMNVTAGAAGSAGIRAAGGTATFAGGAAGGTSGDPAVGGMAIVIGGAGSSNNGAGGEAHLRGGSGGAGGASTGGDAICRGGATGGTAGGKVRLQNAAATDRVTVDDTGLSFFGVATVARQTVNALTDNSGGASGGDTIAAIVNPADSPASADALRDDLVNNVLPTIKNAIATLAAKSNGGRTANVNLGLWQ